MSTTFIMHIIIQTYASPSWLCHRQYSSCMWHRKYDHASLL